MAILRKYLRRYTDLPALVYLLTNRKITLLDPHTWDDTNDSHFLSLYKEKKGFESVLALCFTRTSETYHHWKVFAHGSSGVCISFRRASLLRMLRKQKGIRTGDVEYLKIPEMRPYQQEKEFRVILGSGQKLGKLDIEIPITTINRITLSPWLHRSLYPNIKRMLKSIPGCEALEVVRSTLISNDEWKEFGESACGK